MTDSLFAPWTPPPVEIRSPGDGLPALVHLDGVPIRLLSAGRRSCRWSPPAGYHFVIEDGRLRLQKGGGNARAEILLRGPHRPDLLDGGLREGLLAAGAQSPAGALLAAILAFHPAQRQAPAGTRLHLHDGEEISIAGRVLMRSETGLPSVASWVGKAAAPLLSPWRLCAAAIEVEAAEKPASAHARLALIDEAERRLPPALWALVRAWMA